MPRNLNLLIPSEAKNLLFLVSSIYSTASAPAYLWRACEGAIDFSI